MDIYLECQSRDKDGIKKWIWGGDGIFDNCEFFWNGGDFWSSPEDCWIKTGGKTSEEWNSRAFFYVKIVIVFQIHF